MKYLLPLVSGNLNSIFAVNISIKKSIGNKKTKLDEIEMLESMIKDIK